MSIEPTEESEELFTDEGIAAKSTENEAAEASNAEAGDEVREKASPAARKLEPIVLAHVLGPKYQPVKPRVIAKQLKLPSEQHQALKLAIRRLVKARQAELRLGAFGAAAASKRSRSARPRAGEVEKNRDRTSASESRHAAAMTPHA